MESEFKDLDLSIASIIAVPLHHGALGRGSFRERSPYDEAYQYKDEMEDQQRVRIGNIMC